MDTNSPPNKIQRLLAEDKQVQKILDRIKAGLDYPEESNTLEPAHIFTPEQL
ncbi:MAG: hypothetical protein OFPII_01400 [Osedax symbiont Rs1]|nr:MAG: hypothetical protein OFPII_01400 [Osedax symbiont Rs1]